MRADAPLPTESRGCARTATPRIVLAGQPREPSFADCMAMRTAIAMPPVAMRLHLDWRRFRLRMIRASPLTGPLLVSAEPSAAWPIVGFSSRDPGQALVGFSRSALATNFSWWCELPLTSIDIEPASASLREGHSVSVRLV